MRLVPPHMDKNWSLQGIHFSEEEIFQVKSCFSKMQDASPYLQGNSGVWFMVEFWTRDMKSVNEACQIISDHLNVPFEKVDDSTKAFTRKELGID